MEQNEELQRAWEFAEHTHTSIFLTGKAGTGKTTFLRNLQQHSSKSIVVVAPTGAAAINAGGVTIHSFFQLPLSPYIPGIEIRDKFSFSRDKLRIIRMLDLLVIDEISMVRSDLLDAIDNALRKYRRDSRPFGGVQLMMIGDLQQLSPIMTPQDEELLAPHYPTPYFFSSRALQQIDYVTIELTKVYRQQNLTFINLLNHIRTGNLGREDIGILNSRYIPEFIAPQGSGYIRLTTHNSFADRYNNDCLSRIASPSVTYHAEVKGTFPETSFPTASELTLKAGAQVMFVRNDPSPAHLYYNGKIGHIVNLQKDKITVACGDEAIEVSAAEWQNTRYRVDDTTGELTEDIQGTFTQFPIRLAWSITIHKSQGLTFEHAIIDAGSSFAPGQVYVALSRCKSLEGMVLATPITPEAIMTDTRVSEYVSRQQDEAARSIERLPMIKEAYFRMLVTELFSLGAIWQCEERLARFVGEHCRRTYPQIVTIHRELVTDLRTQVLEVADKWLPVLRRMSDADLHSDATLDRVKRSATYFHDTLLKLFEPMFERITDVSISNKTTASRFKELVTDLFQTTKARLLLLDAIAREGFTIPGYLNNKQRAIAEATRDKSKKITRRKSTAKSAKTSAASTSHPDVSQPAEPVEKMPKVVKVKKEKPPKEPKEASWIESFRMFGDGLTPTAIAERRGLAESTIWTHLTKAMQEGKLDIHDLLDDSTIDSITKAVENFGGVPTLTEIRERLRNKVSFNEIRIVLVHLNP